MALKLACPTCAATFGLPDNRRGKKAFCPRCGQALVVTGAGVAKRSNGTAGAASSPRGLPWLLLAAVLVSASAAGVVGFLALRHFAAPHEPIAANETDREPPPPVQKKEPEPDHGHGAKPKTTQDDGPKKETKKKEPVQETKEPVKQKADPEPKAGTKFVLPLDALGKPERLAKVKGVRVEIKLYDAKGAPLPNGFKYDAKGAPLSSEFHIFHWALTWYAPDRWRIDGPSEKPIASFAINGQNGWFRFTPSKEFLPKGIPIIAQNDWLRAVTVKKSFTGQDAKQLHGAIGWIGVGQLTSLTSTQHKLTLVGPATVKGRPATCVQMTAESSAEIKLYFDNSTRLLAKSEYQGPEPRLAFDGATPANKHLVFYFSDYRETDGIQQWHKCEWSCDGQPKGYTELTSVRFLAEVDETLLIGP